jgi:glycosyltransferase involved in cell wall biosynthesis
MTTTPAHLYILSPVAPFPPRSGGTQHLYQLVRMLSASFRITLCVVHPATQPPTWGDLPDYGIRCLAFAQTPSPHWWLPPMARATYAGHLVQFLRQHVSTHTPCLVQLEFESMLHYQAYVPANAICVATLHNLDSRALTHRLSHTEHWRAWLRRALGIWLVKSYERHYLRRCQAIITHASADAVAVRQIGGTPHPHTIPTGINLPGQHQPLPETPTLLFVGNGRHAANLDGLRWFLEHCWPDLCQKLPGIHLHLVGDALPQSSDTRISTHGMVDDVAPYYACARVTITPIWWGAGIRVKILEAWAFQRPVITTTIGYSGLEEQAAAVIVADTAAQFIDAVVRICTQPDTAAALVTAGWDAVQPYRWEQVGARVTTYYHQLLTEASP